MLFMVLLLQPYPGKHKDRSMRKRQQQSEIQVPAPGHPLLKVPRLPYFPLLTLSARWSGPALIPRRVGGKQITVGRTSVKRHVLYILGPFPPLCHLHQPAPSARTCCDGGNGLHSILQLVTLCSHLWNTVRATN